jgi:Cof subfamily protein (haloacid dehalogenase superfamily)
VSSSPAQLPIRLVAIDLDGTLLDDSKRISEPTVQALADLAPAGIKVVIATARPPRSVRHIYSRLGLDTYQINYNGALIWDECRQHTLFHQPMPGELVRRLIVEVRAAHPDLLVTCEVMDRWYTDRSDQTYTTQTGRLFKPDIVAPIEEFCTQPITKLMFLGPPQLIDATEPLLDGAWREHVSVVRGDRDLIQIMDRRVSKAVALQKVAAAYAIPMRQVMAIGDAPNDVAMLQSAGIAIAMDNAHARCKEVAHWVAPSNNDHGVRAALLRYGLGIATPQ